MAKTFLIQMFIVNTFPAQVSRAETFSTQMRHCSVLIMPKAQIPQITIAPKLFKYA